MNRGKVGFQLAGGLLFVLLSGCDARIENFESNEVYALTLVRSRSTPAEFARLDAAEVVTRLFGTPDEPNWPDQIAQVLADVNPENIVRSAGPFSSERDGTHVGLFREHCVICHGLAGSGTGPASQVQNPYPRDFRSGIFKWKSTLRAAKPTRENIQALLGRGIPGTAMPSFALQQPSDVEALTDYVIYLSIRGEVERRLIAAAIDDLDYGETKPEQSLRLTQSGEGSQVVTDVLTSVANKWRNANSLIAPLPGVSPSESIENGRAIFHGPIANCVGCHGPSGNGNAVTLDYDDWAKEYSTRIGLTPTDRDAMRPFRKAGALRPRLSEPRNLQNGVFHGGGDSETLYRRITQGIAGTSMPAVTVVEQEDGRGLTQDQVWDLVAYLKSLGAGGDR